MSKKMAKSEFNLASPAPLTTRQPAHIAVLRARPLSEVDTSDIPELTAEFWKGTVRNPFYKPTKTATTLRVDSDVLVWLRSKGKGYQTRLNVILREAMLKEVTKA
ncbi:MAG: BrnA antitoxin family protein [Betaproteobacteria bacterium]